MTRPVTLLHRLVAPFVAALLAHAPLAASPDTQRGFGTRSGSLAASNGADVDDASAVFSNPAGLTDVPGTLVAFGYESHANDLTHDGIDAALDTVGTYEIGIAVPGAIRGIPIGFGLSLSLPDGRLSNLRQVEPADARNAGAIAQTAGARCLALVHRGVGDPVDWQTEAAMTYSGRILTPLAGDRLCLPDDLGQ